MNNVYGAVDNFVFGGEGNGDTGDATVEGDLIGPRPIIGLAKLSAPERPT